MLVTGPSKYRVLYFLFNHGPYPNSQNQTQFSRISFKDKRYCLSRFGHFCALIFDCVLKKIKIDGKKITPSKFVKYLGIYLDNFLSWQKQEQDMRSRLSRAAGMLCKIRHYVNFDTLKMVCCDFMLIDFIQLCPAINQSITCWSSI